MDNNLKIHSKALRKMLHVDLFGNIFKLGDPIGTGGFGEIYEVVNTNVKDNWAKRFVAKLEKRDSGPLFVEINCYKNIGNLEQIETWKKENNLDFLGMPHFIGFGSINHNDEQYRFLILPKYTTDLEKVLIEKRNICVRNVLKISMQILNVLEYIHSKGYVHNDIKASNIMLDYQHVLLNNKKSCSNNLNKIGGPTLRIRKRRRLDKLRPRKDFINYEESNSDNTIISHDKTFVPSSSQFNQVHLIDFGLANKFIVNGKHKPFCQDRRQSNKGTLLFCSRDAHYGVFSRRSDLECLGYNMLYWLTGRLPWKEYLEDGEQVARMKNKCFQQLNSFFKFIFHGDNISDFMLEYFRYINKLKFEDKPNYNYIKSVMQRALNDDNYLLDFNETDNCTSDVQKKYVKQFSIFRTIPLKPLNSNAVFKRPKLRKKVKNVPIKDSTMNWSKILADPEIIIKQGRERKICEESNIDWINFDIKKLNPTYAMIEVYNKLIGKKMPIKNKCVAHVAGYTPPMMEMHAKMTMKRTERKKRTKTNSSKVMNSSKLRKLNNCDVNLKEGKILTRHNYNVKAVKERNKRA